MVQLGHVVLYVRNLDTSIGFYRDIVGLTVAGKIFNNRAAVLTGGSTHHELLLIEVGDAPGPMEGRRLGLYHIGWKIGDTLDDLRAVRDRIEQAGIEIDGMADHTISFSIYIRDPDGNENELFVDNPDFDWHESDAWMEQPVKPLSL
ncbi:MAG: glyoxalase [Acidithiobacillales bacterium SG8_45]|jgi:catechol 2,3-dioxygenase|nr:MAG: glyoxalase [Acidithiobacillales bacterium SG8_45]